MMKTNILIYIVMTLQFLFWNGRDGRGKKFYETNQFPFFSSFFLIYEIMDIFFPFDLGIQEDCFHSG